jgi:hypothetical protein
MHFFFKAIVTFFSPAIIRDKDISFSCLASIEALFIVFSALMLSLAKAVDRFFAVLSISAKSLI